MFWTSECPRSQLQHSRFAETEIPFASRIASGPPNNDVIQELDVHGLGGFPELSRHVEVRRTWRRVPARMIVRTDDRRRRFPDRGAKDFPRMSERRRRG